MTKTNWLERWVVWSGGLSLLALFALKLITVFIPQDAYFNEQTRSVLSILVFLPLPGLGLAVVAIAAGAISYRREQTRAALIGLVLGVTTVVIFFVTFLSKNGAQFHCHY